MWCFLDKGEEAFDVSEMTWDSRLVVSSSIPHPDRRDIPDTVGEFRSSSL